MTMKWKRLCFRDILPRGVRVNLTKERRERVFLIKRYRKVRGMRVVSKVRETAREG